MNKILFLLLFVSLKCYSQSNSVKWSPITKSKSMVRSGTTLFGEDDKHIYLLVATTYTNTVVKYRSSDLSIVNSREIELNIKGSVLKSSDVFMLDDKPLIY